MASIRCDECGHVFDFQKSSFARRRDDNPDVEEAGFTCPKCKHETVAVRTDTRVRVLQERVREERERANKRIVSGVAPNRAERKVRQAKRDLKKAMEELAASFT